MDTLSKWFIENEELLYKELVVKVQSETNNQNWSVASFIVTDLNTLLGQLTNRITNGNKGIGVYFTYDKSANPNAQVFLTAYFNKENTDVVDSMFNGVEKLKWFSIQKYGKGTDDGIIEFVSEGSKKVNIKNIRARIENHSSPYDIKFFIKSSNQQFIDKIHETLFKSILGEEVYLKKVKHISYQLTTTLDASLLTVKQLNKRLTT